LNEEEQDPTQKDRRLEKYRRIIDEQVWSPCFMRVYFSVFPRYHFTCCCGRFLRVFLFSQRRSKVVVSSTSKGRRRIQNVHFPRLWCRLWRNTVCCWCREWKLLLIFTDCIDAKYQYYDVLDDVELRLSIVDYTYVHLNDSVFWIVASHLLVSGRLFRKSILMACSLVVVMCCWPITPTIC
jgi:hypothetical protein